MPTAFINGYNAVTFADFSGGLNLRDKADAVGDREAIDLLNVNFTERGAIRQRDGTAAFGSPLSGTAHSLSPFYRADGTRQLVAGVSDGTLVALSADGTVVVPLAGQAGTPYHFARFGSPLAEYLFCADGIDTVCRWDGVSWASGAVLATVNGNGGQAMPRAGAICVTAQASGATAAANAANRLVATAYGTATGAGPGGTQSTPSRAHWSNAGDPHTWETDGVQVGGATPYIRGRNYVDFTPGDGEQVMAAVSWRELTFIFKETKFFVVYGEATNPDGTPRFLYREVVNQAGLASRYAISSGRDGVYFANRRGVYVTTGGEPQLLSDIISPLWTQHPDVYYTGSPINLGRLDLIRALWHMERFFLAIPTGASNRNDRLLAYDIPGKWWTIYDIPAASLASFRATDQPLVFHGRSDQPSIARQAPDASDDAGTPIRALWRSGWGDYGNSQQKTIRETKVWGSGAATVSFAVDFDPFLSNNIDTVFALKTNWPYATTSWDGWGATIAYKWPQIDQVADTLVRRATRGTVFSTQFSSSPQSPVWTVHRVARHLREIRSPSVR